MIPKFLKLLFAFAGIFIAHAQAQDTLWVKRIDGKAYVVHKVNSGEDLFMISKKYSVPPAALADANNLNYQSGLEKGTKIWVPIDNYNFIRIESVVKSKPIFYKVNTGDELNDVSRLSHVSQSTIQRWNHLATPDVRPGDVLQIGWIAFDNSQTPFAPKDKVVPPPTTTPKPVIKPVVASSNAVKPIAVTNDSNLSKPLLDTIVVKNVYEDLYNEQVMGSASNSASGAAVFYNVKIKPAAGVYYAFHNTAAKGTIIKVNNPSNGNFIYAKVIGTIPNLPDYNNSIIALSSNAAKGLMAREKRMFCKIEYR